MPKKAETNTKVSLEEQLILLVHGKTELYDSSSKLYKDEKLKLTMWTEIAEILGVQGKLILLELILSVNITASYYCHGLFETRHAHF